MTDTQIVVATDRAAACAAAGGARSSSGASLTLSFPNGFAGRATIGAGAEGHLSAWANGAVTTDNAVATAGSVEVSVNHPGGGTIGSYDLVFDSTHEQGTFIAPDCDICAVTP
jgi:hypothetical protein